MTTNDTATFNNTDVHGCLMGSQASALTLASLTLSGYTGTLTLYNNLTLSNAGAGASCGSMNGGEIEQQLVNNGVPARITIAAGKFTFSGGNLNQDTVNPPPLGQLTVKDGAELDFTVPQGSTANLGDSLNISGTLKLANPGTVTLYSQSVITITMLGTANVTVDRGRLGLPQGVGVTPETIQSSGVFEKTAGMGTYTIDDPINVNIGTLEVESGTLEFVNGDPTTHYSVNSQGGSIFIYDGATLDAENGVQLATSGANLATIGTGTATIMNPNKEVNVNGGTVSVGNALDSTTANLKVTGDFKFQSGTIRLVYDTTPVTGGPAQIQSDKIIIINATGTALKETFFGTGMAPNSFLCMTAGTSISNICQTNPMMWTASIVGGNQYQLTKGMGMAPSAQETAALATPRSAPMTAGSDGRSADSLVVVALSMPEQAAGDAVLAPLNQAVGSNLTGLAPGAPQGDVAPGTFTPPPYVIQETVWLDALLADLTDGTVPDPATVDALFASLV